MTAFDEVQAALRAKPRRFLVTGAAGFIGSHLTEALLGLGQEVVAFDNLSTGHRENLDEAVQAAGAGAAARFTFLESDLRDEAACAAACRGIDVVLHQAALGSVPRSIENPLASHASNVDGFVKLVTAAKAAGIKRFVYASSSSVYGDEPTLPKVEGREGELLSPYAATKAIDELYARTFNRVYGLECVGLRYFNVFGARQDPNGPYAAVIPRFILAALSGEPCRIFGDGQTSRDFCYVDNVVQANLLAATAPKVLSPAYNVACGDRTTLLELWDAIRGRAESFAPGAAALEPTFQDFRAGDVRHSLADISRIENELGYRAQHHIASGLDSTVRWFAQRARKA